MACHVGTWTTDVASRQLLMSYLTSYFDVVSGVKPSLVAQWLVVQLWHLPAKNFSVGFHSYINPVAMQINSVFV